MRIGEASRPGPSRATGTQEAKQAKRDRRNKKRAATTAGRRPRLAGGRAGVSGSQRGSQAGSGAEGFGLSRPAGPCPLSPPASHGPRQ
eukprot:16434361-Heterocapsa_arctica.AAC.2